MRTNDVAWAATGLTILLLASGLSGGARAQVAIPASAAPGASCGAALSEGVASVWRDLGGAGGRLGCPTSPESTGARSPIGTASRVATFGVNGQILLGTTGPRAGQAFAVSGGCYRLYVQYGGASGWLGLPIADQENTPDGSRQRFEGGVMRWDRALDDCEAEQATAVAQPVAAAPPAEAVAPLDLFEDPGSGARLSLAAAGSVADATSNGYRRLRSQAMVMTQTAPGTEQLRLFVNESAGVREIVASDQSEREALADGFVFEAGQGWIWSDPRPGMITLKLYRDPATRRSQLTAGGLDETDAAAKGYRFVRIEGYAAPPP